METNLMLYIDNEYSIYRLTEWIAGCVAKKIKKGQPVTVEYLAECSTMKKIIAEAKKIMEKYGEDLPNREESKKARYLHAEYIINDLAPYYD